MGKVVYLKQIFKLDINKMFDLWTKPELIVKWMSPDPERFPSPPAQLDPKLGGKYRIVMIDANGEHIVGGQFTNFKRPTLLEYTWQWEGSDEVSNVKVELHVVADGTQVILTHEHPDGSKMPDLHKQGWEHCFEVLGSFS